MEIYSLVTVSSYEYSTDINTKLFNSEQELTAYMRKTCGKNIQDYADAVNYCSWYTSFVESGTMEVEIHLVNL